MVPQRNSMATMTLLLFTLVASSIAVTAATGNNRGAAADTTGKLTFLSGVADTTQSILLPGNNEMTTIKRHHYTCYHRGTPKTYSPPKSTSSSLHAPHPTSFDDGINATSGRSKCCNELYMNGLLDSQFQNYCVEHVALIPDLSDKISRRNNRDVRPVFYLARDEIVIETIVANNTQRVDDNQRYYRQIRQLKVMDEWKEKERLRDMPRFGGVVAFSPFHLAGFMNAIKNGNSNDNTNGAAPALPMKGRVEGTLSKEGGMHRSFWHKVRFTLDDYFKSPSTTTTATTSSLLDHELKINATIFLPLMEDVFIDADDALVLEYGSGHGSSREGIACRVTTTTAAASSSDCKIQFLSSETIDIEQPSFASRQYVVAFQINASLDFSYSSSLSSSALEGLEVVIDYGTTLHIRYPSPIIRLTDDDDDDSNGSSKMNIDEGKHGVVLIAIQQPVLYSAGIESSAKQKNSNNSSDTTTTVVERQYILQTDSSATSNTPTKNNDHDDEYDPPPDPIIVFVAAGLDSDYWWVTMVTMSAAFIGGFVLVKSMDSVSTWC